MPLDHSENSIEWVEAQVSGTRKVKAYAIRKSRAKLIQKLTNYQFDALREIEKAYDDLSNGYGYALLGIKTSKLDGRVAGFPDQDATDRARARLAKLHAWEIHLGSKNLQRYSQVIRAIYLGDTALSYSKRHNGRPSPSTVIDWFGKGLQEYVIQQGWEDRA